MEVCREDSLDRELYQERNGVCHRFIPVGGPVLAIAFSLTWTAMKDEDAFWDELSLWVSAIKLTELFKRI
jgi:hypothetical protein